MSEKERKNDELTEKKILSKEAMKVFDKMQDTSDLERIIKDNMIEFKVDGRLFRVKKPNLNETDEIDEFRRKKYTELIQDDSYLFRKQWIKKYKEKGIDINQMEEEMRLIQAKVKQQLLKLATITEKNIIEDLEKEIETLRQKQYNLSITITEYLGYCIESKLRILTDSYTVCVILETKQGDTWKRYFESYDEFQDSKELTLVSQTFYYFQYLMYNE